MLAHHLQRQPATGATLGYLLDRWLETADFELTTGHTYKGYIKRSICPVLGDLRLWTFSTASMPACASAALSVAARWRPLPCARHFILRAALNLAVRWQWLPSNQAALASPPPFVQKEVHRPTPEDMAKLIEAAWVGDPDFGTLLWLGMTTGARRGNQ